MQSKDSTNDTNDIHISSKQTLHASIDVSIVHYANNVTIEWRNGQSKYWTEKMRLLKNSERTNALNYLRISPN